MRNIEYRGLRVDGNEWEFGDLVHDAHNVHSMVIAFGIRRPNCYPSEVHHNTIGQSLIPDNKGVMIYEGDKIECKGQMCEVRFDESHLYYALFNIAVGCKVVNLSKNNVGKFKMEIIGNIHEKQTK